MNHSYTFQYGFSMFVSFELFFAIPLLVICEKYNVGWSGGWPTLYRFLKTKEVFKSRIPKAKIVR